MMPLQRACGAESQVRNAAMGDGGNIIYVSPNENMVVAITSIFKPTAKDRIEFIKKYVEPTFGESKK